MMRNILTLAGVMLMLTALATGSILAQTDVRLRVTTEGRLLIRIAFLEPDKMPEGKLAEYRSLFMETLDADLEMSGYFEVVKDAAKDAPHATVKVMVASGSEDASFDVDLRDRMSDNTIFRRRYGAAAGRIVRVAHIVADDIVYALTGKSGIADTRLAFVAGAKGESSLYSAHIDGSELSKITGTPTIVMSPAWSPDARRLAYVSYETGVPAVYVTDFESRTTTRFASFDGMNATPEWAPDGKSLALTLSKDGNPEIYVISLDGKTRKRLTNYSGIDCSPTWAPNGVELAFTSDRTGSPQIFITDLEGSGARRITFEGTYNTSPAWSPEGDLIAFVSRIDGRFQICTVDPFGITTTILTEDGNNEHPGWSPDGMHIVFSSTAGGNSGIYIMNRDGNGKRRVFDGLKNARDASWTKEPRRGKPEAIEDQ
jgi:TolB protein